MSNYIDGKALDELRILMGDELGLLYQTFLDDAVDKVELLKTLFEQEDYDQTSRIAHSLKGSSRNIGALYLSDLCESLEKSARQQNISNWNYLISDIKDSFERTATEIKRTILQ